MDEENDSSMIFEHLEMVDFEKAYLKKIPLSASSFDMMK